MKDVLVKTLYKLVATFPNAWAQRLGNMVGGLLYHLGNREKRTAAVNIALCFPDLSVNEQQKLVKNTLQENAKTLLELPKIFNKGGRFAIDLITEVKGIEYYHDALKRSKGVMLLAPHIGNWELTVHYLTQFAPITAMYDPPKQAFLDDLIKSARQSTGATLVPADSTGVRTQLKQLKKGGVVGILPDQVPQHDSAGVYAPFMGNTTFTMTLVNNLAKRSGAVVLMTFAERLGIGKGYCLHVFPAPDDLVSTDAEISATALNAGVEQCVRIAPAQYQWTYKRFKHQANGVEPY